MNDRIPGSCWDNPIWYKNYRIYISDMHEVTHYEYVSDNYDGPGDKRCGHAYSIAEAKTDIDELGKQ